MEKFTLKWNDFEVNASKSFRNLRKEEHFYDVTLVSDDQQLVSAHKLILSASSEFFRNILKQSKHSNPMIYLPGVQSVDLNFVIDYIYNGEVQLYHEDLDNFLNVAQKLKIEGLIEQKYHPDENKSEEEIFYDTKDTSESNSIVKNEVFKFNSPRTKYDEFEKSVSLVNQDYSRAELSKIVDNFFVKDGEMFVCKTCGKSAKTNGNIREHVEIHIEGLSFPCPFCDNTFRTRNRLKYHKQTHKKSF